MCLADVDRGPFGLYSHGVYVVGAMALVLAVVYVIATRDVIGCVIVALMVASHYGLDYFTGIKPTWPGGPLIGLSLYDRPVADLVLEGVTILIGWLLYRRTFPRALRNDKRVYAVLFSLFAFQIAAGVVFFLKMGGQVKC